MIPLLWLEVAMAGVPVVHDGAQPTDPAALVAQRSGLPPEQLDPVPLETLLARPPTVLGPAVLRHCAGSPTRTSDVRSLLVRAEAAWRQGDRGGALDQADLAVAAMACLAERADLSASARVFLLRGSLLAGSDPAVARTEVRTALSLQPQVPWVEGFPPEGQALLEELRPGPAAPQALRLVVAPSASPSGPWIDGRDPTPEGFTLAPGLHLLQVPGTSGIRSAWLTVEGDAALVVPAAFRRPVLERLARPGERADVELLLAATAGDNVYAVQGGGLWLLSREDGQVVTTTLVDPPAPVAVEPTSKKKLR